MSELLLLQLVVVCVLFAAFVWLLRIAFLAADAREWPQAMGEVLASTVTERQGGDTPTEFIVT